MKKRIDVFGNNLESLIKEDIEMDKPPGQILVDIMEVYAKAYGSYLGQDDEYVVNNIVARLLLNYTAWQVQVRENITSCIESLSD